MNKYKLFCLLSLPFAANILAPLIQLLFGIYPYPSFFADETDAQNDFFSICYYTINKASNYGAYRDIYPPLGHLYCWMTQLFYPYMTRYGDYTVAKLHYPDSLPVYFLVILTIVSFILLFRVAAHRFRLKGANYLPWCCVASSPMLMLFDRGNLLMVGLIFLNLAIIISLRSGFSLQRPFILLCLAVPVGIKPYLILPFMSMPRIAAVIIFLAIVENIFAYILWQPPAIELIVDNLRGFTDGSIVIPSIPALIVDGQAWTSYLQYSKLLLKSISVSSQDFISYIIPTSIVSMSFLLYLSYLFLLILVFFELRRVLPRTYSFRFRMMSSHDNSFRYKAIDEFFFYVYFCSSFVLLFAFLPIFTKSVYWYSIVHILPFMLICEIIMLSNQDLYSTRFIFIYNFVKCITLTTLVPPFFNRLCLARPVQARIVDSILNSFGFDLSLPPDYRCFVPHLLNIVHFCLRMINLPLLCSLIAVTFLLKARAVLATSEI